MKLSALAFKHLYEWDPAIQRSSKHRWSLECRNLQSMHLQTLTKLPQNHDDQKSGASALRLVFLHLEDLVWLSQIDNPDFSSAMPICLFSSRISQLSLTLKPLSSKPDFEFRMWHSSLSSTKGSTHPRASSCRIFDTTLALASFGTSSSLGHSVDKNSSGYYRLRQTDCIDKVVEMSGLKDAKTSSVPSVATSQLYQELLGYLLYISVSTRPDVALLVSSQLNVTGMSWRAS